MPIRVGVGPTLGRRLARGPGLARLAALAQADESERVLLWLLTSVHDAARKANAPAIRVATQDDGTRASITVADNGPGIAPENAAKIFTPFFTTRSEGVGLALAVAHAIAHDHGGSLDFAPAPGGGTAFTLRLPGARRAG